MTATLEAPAMGAPGEFEPEPPPVARPVPAALQPWRDPHPRLGWLITLAIAVVAGFTRFWALGFPPSKVFDEVYYSTEAQELLRYGYEDNRDYMFIVHPPLGKWLIGLGEMLFPQDAVTDSLGWRFAGAVIGVLTVVIMTRLARRMFRSELFGAIAGLLLTMDGMSLVLARTAILDAYLEFFVLAAFAALVMDRERVRARLAQMLRDGIDTTTTVPTLGPRPWRLLGGVLLGAACAVKWTGAWFFLAFILLSLLWDRSALRAAGCRRPLVPWLRRSVRPAVGSLLLAPIATYLVSYLGWFVGENSWGRHWADTHSTSTKLHLLGMHIPWDWGWLPGPIRSLGAYTLDAYRFHTSLTSFHPYRSNPWSWLVLGRPVDFYYDGNSHSCGQSLCSRTILLMGTPLMWWAFVPMLIWLAWHWITTRDWRAGAVWMAFLAGWAVWFLDIKRTMFLFYMAPLVPFLILGLTLALGTVLGPALRRTGDAIRDRRAITRRYWGIAGVSAFMAIVAADFAWMWPIFTGGLLTYDRWHAHMWLPSWV